jgi:hypothetical protein
VVTLAQVKRDCKVFTAYWDTDIQSHLDGAIDEFDGLGSRSNRVLGLQTYEVFLSAEASEFSLTLPDVAAVTKLELLSSTGIRTEVPVADYSTAVYPDGIYIDLKSTSPFCFREVSLPSHVLTVTIGADPVPPKALSAIRLRVRQMWAGHDAATEKAIDRACSDFRHVPWSPSC